MTSRDPLLVEPTVQRALRKGRIRRGVLLTLLPERELTVEQITHRLATDRELVVWAVVGNPPKFRTQFALGRLGLVRWCWRPTGWSLELTQQGRDVAGRLAEGWEP